MKKQWVKKKNIIIIALILLCVIAFCLWQNNWLVVTEYEYRCANLPDSFDGYTIVQISDLHNKEYPSDNQYLLHKIEKCKPDIIVITGDMVDSNHTDINVALELAANVVEIAPTYYITGNHEFWLSEEDRSELLAGLEKAGVICMDNSCRYLQAGEDQIGLIGLGDQNLADGTLSDLLKQLQENAEGEVSDTVKQAAEVQGTSLNILLAHEPQYIDKYAQTGVNLVLSGHAHGGQFRLPFVGGVVAPDQGLFPEYTEGLHEVDDTSMIISRGIGNSVIPLRLFNCPEIVCVRLSK